jgi:quercetin dioxygenase-like cupin family protein
MASEYLIDLKGRKFDNVFKMPDGNIGEEQSSIIPAEGERAMFWMTDSIMHKMPEGRDPDESHMSHEHRHGFETFFVDSGKMWLYMNGTKCLLTQGDILHLQAGMAHGMGFLEDVKYRGFFHDYHFSPDLGAFNKAKEFAPDDPELDQLRPPMDFINRERMLFKEIPAEQCTAVRNPARPLAEYKLDGVTLKIITQRWENAGCNELCCAEMEPGFTAEWVKYPTNRELFYVRNGEVKFKIFNEEFIADSECLVNIPKFAPHSLEALTKAEVYDMGGLTLWASFLHDYMSIKTYDPERFGKPETIEELKKKFNCQIQCIGMKK